MRILRGVNNLSSVKPRDYRLYDIGQYRRGVHLAVLGH